MGKTVRGLDVRPQQIVERVKSLFEDTHWIKRHYSTSEGAYGTELWKLKFCLLGGLRFVQAAYEDVINGLEPVTYSKMAFWFQDDDEADIPPHFSVAHVAEHPLFTDDEAVTAVATAIFELYPYRCELNDGPPSREAAEGIIIHFNDDYDTGLEDVLAVLTRAGEILEREQVPA